MKTAQTDPQNWFDPEIAIARYRLLFGVLALFIVWADPALGGPFTLDWRESVAVGGYVFYAAIVLLLLRYARVSPQRETVVTTVLDVIFSVGVACVTAPHISPFFVFVAFTVLAAGVRTDYGQTLLVTAVVVVLYLAVRVVLGGASIYPAKDVTDWGAVAMSLVYLSVMGFSMAALGKTYRFHFERIGHRLAKLTERNHLARTLHDGHLQTMAGVGLHLEAIRIALERGEVEAARADLAVLTASVSREHDALRAFLRSLAAVKQAKSAKINGAQTEFHFVADTRLTAAQYERVSGILREAAANVRRHAHARHARLRCVADEKTIQIMIDDDGVGFSPGTPFPWSIASRVTEVGGRYRLVQRGEPGAHIEIILPREGST